MKITVIPSKQKPQTISYNEIEPGTIYQVKDGTIILKLHYDAAVLLEYPSGGTYLEIAKGYRAFPAVKILGKISEIVVEEE